MPVPRCAARRRDNQPCGALAASPEASFCRHHEKLVAIHGEAAVRAGRYPRHRNPIVERAVAAEAKTPYGNGNTPVSPAEVRPALAQAAADELDTIRTVLLDAATNTTRPAWTTPTCPDCGKKFRQEVLVPDHKARVAAVEVLLREGLGRVAQAEEPTVPRLPESAEAVKNMSWKDMQLVIATLYADEIAAVANDQGDALLRQRLAVLTDGARNALREALDAA